MISKYKRKTCTVEAIQWTGNNTGNILEFCRRVYIIGNEIVIKTNNGNLRASPGTYIVKEYNGDLYCYTRELFVELFDQV